MKLIQTNESITNLLDSINPSIPLQSKTMIVQSHGQELRGYNGSLLKNPEITDAASGEFFNTQVFFSRFPFLSLTQHTRSSRGK